MLSIEATVVDFVDGPDFSAQFERVLAASPPAIYVPANTYFAAVANRELLAALQIANRVPLLAGSPAAQPRALIGYGANPRMEERKPGSYIDAFLKGAKAGDLPFQQPAAFDPAINLATAKTIGITIPPLILAQATLVIE